MAVLLKDETARRLLRALDQWEGSPGDMLPALIPRGGAIEPIPVELSDNLTEGGQAQAYLLGWDGSQWQLTGEEVTLADRLSISGGLKSGQKVLCLPLGDQLQPLGRGSLLRHGKVQAGWTQNYQADVRLSVPVRECDADGSNERGDEIVVFTARHPGWDTYLFAGDVVDWLPTASGDRVIVSPHLDRPIGTVMPWSGATENPEVRPGWFLCTGENGTIDLRGRFVVGYWPDGNPQRNEQGDAGDYGDVGATGGYAWHGKTFNGHPDHPEHRHTVDDSVYQRVNVAAGTDLENVLQEHWTGTPPKTGTSEPASEPGPDPDWTHPGEYQQDDTDNRPPYYVLAFIQRVA